MNLIVPISLKRHAISTNSVRTLRFRVSWRSKWVHGMLHGSTKVGRERVFALGIDVSNDAVGGLRSPLDSVIFICANFSRSKRRPFRLWN